MVRIDPQQETPDRLLDAAEICYAEHGFDASSVRMITALAGVNIAAVNYHFGNKDGLLAATLLRRIEPINAARLAQLTAAEELAAGEPVPLAAIIEAFARPCFAVVAEPHGDRILLLMGRVLSDPHRHRAIAGQYFRPVVERFQRALGNSLPELPETERQWRFQFMLGAMIHCLLSRDILAQQSGGRCDVGDVEAAVRAYRDFVLAGWLGEVTR